MLVSGSADAFLSAPGTAPNVVILSGGGRVPETGAVDLSQLSNATAVTGVLAASPEVYAPVLLAGRVVVVRGVDPAVFSSFQAVRAVAGTMAPLDNSTVYVGTGLASALGLGVGAALDLKGVMANSSASVRVAAVVSVGAPYDGEIISSLTVARDLRGLGPTQATFERLKVDPATFNSTALLQALGGGKQASSAANPLVQELQLAPTAVLLTIAPAGAQTPSASAVFSRGVAVVQTAFESLDAVVLAASVLAVYFATSYWLDAVKPTGETLEALGMRRRKELAWRLASAVPAALMSALAGTAAAYFGLAYLSGTGSLQILFQPLQVSLGPAALAVSCLGPTAAVAASIALTLSLWCRK